MIAAQTSAQTTRPVFTGEWAVNAVPIESSRADGATEAKHTLTFDTNTVIIEGPLGGAFGPATYETAWPDFRIILRHDKLGTLLWTGKVQDTSMDGLIRWTRADGKILTYRFNGERIIK